MTLDKWNKIKALMESPASSDNEKEICRKLLKDNPKPDPPVNPFGPLGGGRVWRAPRTQDAGDFWSRAQQAEKSFSQQSWDEYTVRQARQPYNQAQEEAQQRAEENTRRKDGRARRGGPEFFKADCDDCRRPFTTWVDGPRRCRACKAQGSGQQYHSTLGDAYRDAQRTSNRFMAEMARLLADDFKKKGDK